MSSCSCKLDVRFHPCLVGMDLMSLTKYDQVEVMSDKPNTAIFWQYGTHDPAYEYCVDWSKRVYTSVMDDYFKTTYCLTAPRAWKYEYEARLGLVYWILIQITSKTDEMFCLQKEKAQQNPQPNSSGEPDLTPVFQQPKQVQLLNMLPAFKRRQ
jgi:hypothetical protein